MPVQIPPWIRPPDDPAQAYISAYHAGAAVAGEQAKLQVQANAQANEIAVAEQRLQEQHMREQQQMEMTKAYHDATIGLRQQQLATAQEKIQQAGQLAATRSLALQAYQSDLASGLKPAEAALRHPELFPSMAGFGATARVLQEQQEPFHVTTETVDGQKIFYMGKGHAAFPPQQAVGAEGPLQLQPILDPVTKQPVPGAGSFPTARGPRPYTFPKVVNPNKAEIAKLEKDYGKYFSGELKMPTEKVPRAAVEAARKRYDALKAATPGQPQPTLNKSKWSYNSKTGDLDLNAPEE